MASMESARISLVCEDVKLTAFFQQETFFTLDTEDFESMLATFGLENPASESESIQQQQPGGDTVAVGSLGQQSLAEDQRRRRHRKVQFILDELLSTERDYVRDLRDCLDVYLWEMTCGVGEKPTGIRGKDAVVFGNLQDIYHFHRRVFLEELVDCSRAADVARCFAARAGQFERLYVDYCRNKPLSSRLVLEHAGAYFKHIQAVYGLGLAGSLDSCLIKPIQRITKYQLLLKDLASCCEEGEGVEVRHALDVMQGVPAKANHAMNVAAVSSASLQRRTSFSLQRWSSTLSLRFRSRSGSMAWKWLTSTRH